jgi:FkbM family methyltransferase
VLDIGANIGVHTLELSRGTHALGGEVHAFEAQRQVFYMLAGNVAINSHFNVHCHHAAMGSRLRELLFELGYSVFVLNRLNFICVHPDRPSVGFTGLEEVFARQY